MLELIHCTKKYGNKTALNDLSVKFETGVYGLLGANGAGKSTMLNLITDNIPRTSGEILYNGKDILSLGRGYRKRWATPRSYRACTRILRRGIFYIT